MVITDTGLLLMIIMIIQIITVMTPGYIKLPVKVMYIFFFSCLATKSCMNRYACCRSKQHGTVHSEFGSGSEINGYTCMLIDVFSFLLFCMLPYQETKTFQN